MSNPLIATAAAEREKQWDDLLAAAKKEGKVVVQPVGPGTVWGSMLSPGRFPASNPRSRSFPDGATYIPKIQAERRAAVPAIPPLQIVKHEGAYESLRPVIFRPDVLDDNLWHGGFEGRWADIPKQKWKGKIIMSDVRQGYVYSPSSVLRKLKGDNWLRCLLIDQQPEQVRDRRQAVEGIVRGRHPLAFGIHPFILEARNLHGEVAQTELASLRVFGSGADLRPAHGSRQ